MDESDSEVTSNIQRGKGRGHNISSTGLTATNSMHKTYFVRTGDIVLLESYHLAGMENYSLWAYQVMNILKQDSLFTWCTTPPSLQLTEEEMIKGRDA